MDLGCEPIKYKCINCGDCCSRLLIDRQGVRKGLPLLPSETELFRKNQLRPAYGIGEDPKQAGFRVISYQLRLNKCPHRRFGGCVVWAYRPSICKSYPFVPVITNGWKITKFFDMTCTALSNYVKDYPNGLIPVDQGTVQTESESYPIMSGITEKLLSSVNRAWFYNLKTGRWVPFKNMLP